jgi:hypothetical protein
MRSLTDEVSHAMNRALAEGIPFGRRDVMAWIDGDTKRNRPGNSIGAQIDRELRARRDAGEIELAGNSAQGAALWRRVGSAQVEKPAAPESATGKPAELLPPIPDESMAAVLALESEMKHAASVEFHEQLVHVERFEIAQPAVLQNGVTMVWAARTTDGMLFEDVEAANRHQAALSLRDLMMEFMSLPGNQGLITSLSALDAWEKFKAGRVAP